MAARFQNGADRTAAALHPASYKGAPFFVNKTSTKVGKKIAKKQVAGADRQILEELGVAPRAFSLQCTVAAITSESGDEVRSYADVRDGLLRAIESPGSGTLVHPDFGSIPNCVAMPSDLKADMTSIGMSTITILFEIDTPSKSQPVPTEHKVSDVLSQNAETQVVVETKLENDYVVSTANGGNFADAMDSLQGFIDTTRTHIDGLSVAKDRLDEIAAALVKFETDRAANLQEPATLAESFKDLMGLLNGSYGVAQLTPGELLPTEVEVRVGTGDAFRDTQGIFSVYVGFTAQSDTFPLDTFSRQQRRTNRNTFDTAVRTSALGFQYENSSQVAYGTVREIDAAIAILEAEWTDLRDILEPESFQSLANTREEALGFFEAAKLAARRVTTVFTAPTSARLLAYQYYGESTLGPEIAALNALADPSFLRGNVDILTTGPGVESVELPDAA